MSQDFIGAGWSFPPDVTPSGGVALVRNHRELEQAIRIILTTYPGERPMRPDFGSHLRDYVFAERNTATSAALRKDVRNALLRWEPRVDVHDVVVTYEPDDPSTLYLDIQYSVKGTNDKRNLVFPFYTIPEEGGD